MINFEQMLDKKITDLSRKNAKYAASIVDIASRHGSPFYLYDCAMLQENFARLRATFPDCVDIFYSLKANPNLTICSEFCRLGAGAEVCSLIELETALRAGFSPDKILFLGPAKTDAEIRRSLEADIYAIVCESKRELALISQLAGELGKSAPVLLRINPNFTAKSALLKMGGQPSQFGIDQEELLRDEQYFLTMPNIKIIGIHIYNGTRILDAATIVTNTKNILELAAMLSEKWRMNWEVVDIGGGIGVPYFNDESTVDFDYLQAHLLPVISQYSTTYKTTKIILESGRFLVASSGDFVAEIIDIKRSKGETFVITNGGTNCFMAAVGTGSLLKRNFPIALVRRCAVADKKEPAQFLCHITGPLCTPGDVIAKNVILAAPNIGDLIIIFHAGAYGLTASPVLFLSHGYPMEIAICDDVTHLIRSKLTSEQLLSLQNIVH